ncbi:putative adipose-regulatory protein-domain-containing protein [Catenaria anguillulae PL171]|uniref:Putative adipose-regulatory protein-domain-containing protein n=1 Tax=Catenaria anguillulae PL171 TaxID=765915 RepID=A0A1Y2H943_9FUNG|nr:putative adipose-regulatory protein-domain-containing protein [Catenaria anguillulae PL171]
MVDPCYDKHKKATVPCSLVHNLVNIPWIPLNNQRQEKMLRDALLFVFAPILGVVEPHYHKVHDFVSAPKTHRFVLKSLVFAALFALLFSGAVLAYAALYSLYVPNVGFSRTVPLVSTLNNGTTLAGHVLLAPNPHLPPSYSTAVAAKDLSLLSNGQPYDVSLHLRMPKSPHNIELGTFAAHLALVSPAGTPLYWSAAPVTLKYTTPLADALTTVFWAIPTVLGYRAPTDRVAVDLVSGVISPAPVPPPAFAWTAPVVSVPAASEAEKDDDYTKKPSEQATSGSWWPLASSSSSSGSPLHAQPPGSLPADPSAVHLAVAQANKHIPATALRAYIHHLEHWRYAHTLAPTTIPPPPPSTVPLPHAAASATTGAAAAFGLPSDVDRTISHAVVSLHAPTAVPHVYGAELRVDAQFHGLRYLMYHWFFTSASIGVGLLMVWEVIVGLAVWRVVIGKRITVEVYEEEEEDEEEEEGEFEEEEEDEDDGASESGSSSSSSSSSSDEEEEHAQVAAAPRAATAVIPQDQATVVAPRTAAQPDTSSTSARVATPENVRQRKAFASDLAASNPALASAASEEQVVAAAGAATTAVDEVKEQASAKVVASEGDEKKVE